MLEAARMSLLVLMCGYYATAFWRERKDAPRRTTQAARRRLDHALWLLALTSWLGLNLAPCIYYASELCAQVGKDLAIA
jgi:hypothetical protein